MRDYQRRQHTQRVVDRRNFLWEIGGGLGGIALASMLQSDGLLAANAASDGNPLARRMPHFTPRAKHVIQIFCPGAVSHLDTFDYKPELVRRDGQPLRRLSRLRVPGPIESLQPQSSLPFELTTVSRSAERNRVGLDIRQLFGCRRQTVQVKSRSANQRPNVGDLGSDEIAFP